VVDSLWSGLDPGLVGRAGWEREETERDMEVLAWLGRFRFVTAKAVAEQFGVSWQRANARLRRLERAGLVGFERAHVSQARAVFLTARGARLLGWERHRAPRPEMHREHEEAIVWIVVRLERRDPETRVLTERECRRGERDGERFSVTVLGDRRGERRWPDVVLTTPTGRRALELEFAPKATKRLERIIGECPRICVGMDELERHVCQNQQRDRVGGRRACRRR
jgi:DNA-binding MarR family transcriptional regulator